MHKKGKVVHKIKVEENNNDNDSVSTATTSSCQPAAASRGSWLLRSPLIIITESSSSIHAMNECERNMKRIMNVRTSDRNSTAAAGENKYNQPASERHTACTHNYHLSSITGSWAVGLSTFKFLAAMTVNTHNPNININNISYRYRCTIFSHFMPVFSPRRCALSLGAWTIHI